MSKIQKFNERIAVQGTILFGSMWTFYAFLIWGALGMLPWFPPRFTSLVLLISSAWIQLWALPLIAVGSSVRGRAAEKRSIEDHKMLIAEFQEIREMHVATKAIIQDIHTLLVKFDEDHTRTQGPT